MRRWLLVVAGFAILGLMDAGYLAWEHFGSQPVPCRVSVFGADCGAVLSSKYATVGPVPVALLGVGYYAGVWGLAVGGWLKGWKWVGLGLLLVTTAGVGMSAVLVYLQLVVIRAICFYCMLSAVNTGVLWGLSWMGVCKSRWR